MTRVLPVNVEVNSRCNISRSCKVVCIVWFLPAIPIKIPTEYLLLICEVTTVLLLFVSEPLFWSCSKRIYHRSSALNLNFYNTFYPKSTKSALTLPESSMIERTHVPNSIATSVTIPTRPVPAMTFHILFDTIFSPLSMVKELGTSYRNHSRWHVPTFYNHA